MEYVSPQAAKACFANRNRVHELYSGLRDGICLERMHRAFDRKLMAYGMIQGVKA